MKLIAYYDNDCKACFDDLLYSMLELKNKNRIKEFFYKTYNLVILDSDFNADQLMKIFDEDTPIEHKFSKLEIITDSEYEEYKKDFRPYTKSLFD